MRQTLHCVRIAIMILLAGAFTRAQAQLTSSGCPGLTAYTNGMSNDVIYYFPVGVGGDLTATPSAGTPGWTFTWSQFLVGNSSWTAFSTVSNAPTSTLNNLNPGCYSVTITDGSGNAVGCYRAWILQVLEEGTVDVQPIPPACGGPINLVGTIDYGSVSAYSNLPASQMLIDANTAISICFSGTHTWVSDLAFHVIGPASCGSPNLLLLPNPGAIGQGTVCNSGDNINNLCFSTESTNNINVCAPAPATLAGTYGTYGPSNTPIAWSTLYGCDASSGGWSVQIYDCIGGDIGALTDATLTFTGTDGCGSAQTVTYSTPPGYSSGIADLSCSATSASIFTVPPQPAPPAITCTYGYEWNATPYVYIADSTTSLNITLNQLTDLNGNIIPWQDVVFSLEITSSCDDEEDGNSCFGGDSYDEELFDFTPLSNTFITPVPVLCNVSPVQQLIADYPGGTWSGNGIVDPVAGLFDPAVAGIGVHTITYSVADPCVFPSTIDIEVQEQPEIFIEGPDGLCIDASPFQFADYTVSIGTYFGNGITDATLGNFDPAVAGVGQHTITISIGGICPNSASAIVEVYALPVVNAGPDSDVCPNAPFALNASGAATYVWSPATYLSSPNVGNPNATILNDISYTVTGTSVNGCVDTDNISLTLLPEPEITVGSAEIICPGTTIQLSATASAGDISWSPSSGMSGQFTPNPSVTPLSTTTYTATVTDNCGLTAEASVTVPVEELYSVDAGPDLAYCFGESALIEAELEGSSPSIVWTTTNGLIGPNNNQPSLTVASPGVYEIHVTSPLGCIYEDAVTVNETQLPYLNLADTVFFCPGETATLQAGMNWDQVIWSTGAGTPTIVVSSEGLFDVTVTDNNCSSSGSIFADRVELPYVSLGPDIEICQGETEMLAIGVPGDWSTGQSGSSIVVGTAGTYAVTVDVQQCSVTDSINVIVHPLPIADLPQVLTGCVDQPLTIYGYHPYNTAYEWSTGETGMSIDVITPNIYYLTTSNDCGSATDFVEVNFEDCSYSVYIPNSFTPDYDGINDVWKVSTFNVKNFHVDIFDRWGTLIFRSDDPEAVWTGDVRTGDYFAPDGVYMYHITFEIDNFTDKIERTGSLIILR